jgi:uncharacterized protein (DUF433 family)
MDENGVRGSASSAGYRLDKSGNEVLEDYPDLNRDDVLACIAYGAEMSRERYVEIAVETSS